MPPDETNQEDTYHCECCECELDRYEIHYANSVALCEDCFYESWNYCCRCDGLVHNDDVRYDQDGDPMCEECYDDNVDDDAPVNPEVSEIDRTYLLRLCHSWLNDTDKPCRIPLRINSADFQLPSIREKAGLLSKPLYCFGLVDREEYQIRASSDILDKTRTFLSENNIEAVVIEERGSRRIGISRSLREKSFDQVVQLIQSLTKKQEKEICAE
jgi:hypothetical protein